MYAALPRLELMVSRASLAAVEYYHYTDGRMLLKRSSLALALVDPVHSYIKTTIHNRLTSRAPKVTCVGKLEKH